MTEFITTYYLWIKAFHLISVIAWMAGLFYLPRLFIYHTAEATGSAASETFKVMERRLFKIIMNPAMVLSWIFGIVLVMYNIESGTMTQGWLHGKLLLVVLLTLFHKMCFFHLLGFAKDQNKKSAKYYRIFNEVPTILMIIIVILVIVKPF